MNADEHHQQQLEQRRPEMEHWVCVDCCSVTLRPVVLEETSDKCT